MASMKWKGIDIAGGGMSVLQMTRAEYEANKQALDASDLLIDITDEEPSIATADEIPYTASMSVKEALDSVCQINNPNMVETLTPLSITSLVGSGYIQYYKIGTRVTLYCRVDNLPANAASKIATMPQGYRPFRDGLKIPAYTVAGAHIYCIINMNGDILMTNSTASVVNARGNLEFDAFN